MAERLFWLVKKIQVIFASTKKTIVTSYVENNPAFIRVRMIDFCVEMKWKLKW